MQQGKTRTVIDFKSAFTNVAEAFEKLKTGRAGQYRR